MFGHYILKGHTPVLCEDAMEWARAFEGNRIVVQTTRNKLLISTVFLGLDHGIGRGEKPLLFETMVFPEGTSNSEEYCERYSTWEEAQRGHLVACQKYIPDYKESDLFLDIL